MDNIKNLSKLGNFHNGITVIKFKTARQNYQIDLKYTKEEKRVNK